MSVNYLASFMALKMGVVATTDRLFVGVALQYSTPVVHSTVPFHHSTPANSHTHMERRSSRKRNLSLNALEMLAFESEVKLENKDR